MNTLSLRWDYSGQSPRVCAGTQSAPFQPLAWLLSGSRRQVNGTTGVTDASAGAEGCAGTSHTSAAWARVLGLTGQFFDCLSSEEGLRSLLPLSRNKVRGEP